MKATYQTIPDDATPLTVNNGAVEGDDSHSGNYLPDGTTQLFSTWTPKAKGAAVLLGAWCGMAWCGMVLYQGISPFSMDAAPWNLLSSSGGANTIKMCVEEYDLITLKKSKGALVSCKDKDPISPDHMAEGTTGDDGCVTMTYTNQSWDSAGGRSPDIYCSVNKQGFVQSVPEDKDNHDQNKLAEFNTILYRDRSSDYGHTNGCGPEITEALNAIPTMVLQFEDQCFHHDKCYWDCIILDAFNKDKIKAQEFCDAEMDASMYSQCYYRHGNLPGGEVDCFAAAKLAKGALGLGGSVAYTLDCKEYPQSYTQNDYSKPPCSPDGHKCGYDGTTSDDLQECANCCNQPTYKDAGNVWDDYYCKCLPKDFNCGNEEKCVACCNGSVVDEGRFSTSYICK